MAMDLITTTPTPTTTGAPRSPDSDTDTPPPQPTKRFHHHLHHHHAPPLVSYKECMKNHAATLGGHALDGCCEFMPGPTSTPTDPTSLTCAACGCHRNFHRRDPDDPTPLTAAPRVHARGPHSPSQLLLSLSGGTHSPSDNNNNDVIINTTTTASRGGGGGVVLGYCSNSNMNGGQNGNYGTSKKRHRTKFSQEQKERMHEFSDKIGWKLRKGDERLVEEFCKHVGVTRGVFKVWMHNNKHKDNNNNNNTNHHQLDNGNSNGSNNNGGNCGASVVVHEFYSTTTTNGPQETQ